MSEITIKGDSYYVDEVGLQVIEVADTDNVIPFDDLEQSVQCEIIDLYY